MLYASTPMARRALPVGVVGPPPTARSCYEGHAMKTGPNGERCPADVIDKRYSA